MGYIDNLGTCNRGRKADASLCYRGIPIDWARITLSRFLSFSHVESAVSNATKGVEVAEVAC